MNYHSECKKLRMDNGDCRLSNDSADGHISDASSDFVCIMDLEKNSHHPARIMQSLNKLKKEQVLCDVTLIAEDERFEVHKIILVACSDYFRSMFTGGMKESSQREIELKGITSKGLEKVLEVIYTSTTTLEGDDIFDVIAASTHLQVTPVIEFCEKNFLSGMTTSNFYDFINTARFYNMNSALRQIDSFISKNLLQISRDGTLHLLTYEQILACLNFGSLSLREIDIFQAAAMINKRAYFYAGLLKNRIWAVGGKLKEGSLAAVECYDPDKNTWTASTPLPSAYHAHAGAAHGGKIYISGGYSSNHFTPDLQRFDPVSRRWKDMSAMLSPRGWHVMCVARDKLLVHGGCSLNAGQMALPVMQSESYDPETDQWSAIAPLSVSHKEASCVVYHDRVYVLGGYNVQTKTGQKLVSRYDPYSAVWDSVGTLAQSHTGVGYCVLKLPVFDDAAFDVR